MVLIGMKNFIYFGLFLYFVMCAYIVNRQLAAAYPFFQRTGDDGILARALGASFFLILFINFPASISATFFTAATVFSNLLTRWFWFFPVAFVISLVWFLIIEYLLRSPGSI